MARQAKLPAQATAETLDRLKAEGKVEVRRRSELWRGRDALLYFLAADPNAADFLPA
jgi:predicted ArsR family transcriptional regulator